MLRSKSRDDSEEEPTKERSVLPSTGRKYFSLSSQERAGVRFPPVEIPSLILPLRWGGLKLLQFCNKSGSNQQFSILAREILLIYNFY